MIFKKIRKRKVETKYGMNTTEELLLLETRLFMISLIKDNTHRMSRWQKSLKEGSVNYSHTGERMKMEITTKDRLYDWVFEYNIYNKYVEVIFKDATYNYSSYVPLDEEKMINEIKDLLVLSHYADILNNRNYESYNRKKPSIEEHIKNMHYSYAFDYNGTFLNLFEERFRKLKER